MIFKIVTVRQARYLLVFQVKMLTGSYNESSAVISMYII